MPRGWSWGKKRDSGYRSKAEEEVAKWLMDHEIAFQYESLKLEYYKTVRGGICLKCGEKSAVKQKRSYTPDFVLDNGILIEYKGRLTSQDRNKLIAVKESNPDVNLKLLFGSNNKLNKGTTKRYADWAAEHGFDYHIGKQPPKRWLSRR